MINESELTRLLADAETEGSKVRGGNLAVLNPGRCSTASS